MWMVSHDLSVCRQRVASGRHQAEQALDLGCFGGLSVRRRHSIYWDGRIHHGAHTKARPGNRGANVNIAQQVEPQHAAPLSRGSSLVDRVDKR